MSDEQPRSRFIDRWSARKQQARQPVSGESSDLTGKPEPIVEDHPQAPISGMADIASRSEMSDLPPADDELVLSDEDMPPVESLSSESDISMFFNRGVSAALKKAALRHVFLQPKYNVRDGLNDYDGDFTQFEPLGDTITSDMKWHTARKERARLEAEQRELEALAEESEEHQTQPTDEDETDVVADKSQESHAADEAHEEQDENEDRQEVEALGNERFAQNDQDPLPTDADSLPETDTQG